PWIWSLGPLAPGYPVRSADYVDDGSNSRVGAGADEDHVNAVADDLRLILGDAARHQHGGVRGHRRGGSCALARSLRPVADAAGAARRREALESVRRGA